MTSTITQRQREGKWFYDCLLGRSQAGRAKYKYATCGAREKERGTENLLLDPLGQHMAVVHLAAVSTNIAIVNRSLGMLQQLEECKGECRRRYWCCCWSR